MFCVKWVAVFFYKKSCNALCCAVYKTDPESTFVASACECGVAVQGDGFQVPDPMFKYCKLILAGIGGGTKCVPEGYRPEGKPRKARNKTNPEGAVLPRRPLQKKKITIEFRPRGFRNFCRGFCILLPGQQLQRLQKMKRPGKRNLRPEFFDRQC